MHGSKEVPRHAMSPDEGNHLYQRELAMALVASLGFDGALEVCQSNGWEGVLGRLLVKRPTTSTHTLRHHAPIGTSSQGR